MTLKKTGRLWRGDNFDDLAEYIRFFKAGGYPVSVVVEPRCGECDGLAFRVDIDEEDATRRACLTCGGEEFAVAVGYAFFDEGEVRWISVGLRCLMDGALGVYADTKIDYSPSRHLLAQA
ncbi:hypothetical protein [Micromonospora maritima]|uniref:hypothetical protein n=1 Tax=Micromonospora maritima TaxID=986711 RepID=UPI00378728E4